jgi:glycogen operon protein
MLLAGDELGRSQRGNNNAYCQDNEISWIDWDLDDGQRALRTFVRRLIGLRQRHPLFRRRHFFQGRAIKGADIKDILWIAPDGAEMTDGAWTQEQARTLGVLLNGQGIQETDARGRAVRDASFLLLINAGADAVDFVLPAPPRGKAWSTFVDTYVEDADPPHHVWQPGEPFPLQPRSLAVLTEPIHEERDR